MALKLKGSTSGSVELNVPAAVSGGDVTLTLPNGTGVANQFLKNGSAAGTLEYSSMVETSTGIGIGTSSPIFLTDIVSGAANTGANANNPSQLSITGANKTLTGGGATVFINSNSDLAADTGGSIAFSGRNTTSSTNSIIHATIKGAKENATSTNGNAYLAFATQGHSAGALVERMRISSGGSLLLASRTSDDFAGAGTLFQDSSGGTSPVYLYFKKTFSGTRDAIDFRHSGTQVGSITFSNSNTAYNTSSDYRLKENIVDLTGAIARVNQLSPRRFNFIGESDTVDGFVAHEAQAVVPEAVHGTHNGVEVWDSDDDLPDGVSVGDSKLDENENTIPKYQGIDQSKLVPLLTAALQEAIAKIETLEARVTTLEAS